MERNGWAWYHLPNDAPEGVGYYTTQKITSFHVFDTRRHDLRDLQASTAGRYLNRWKDDKPTKCDIIAISAGNHDGNIRLATRRRR